MGSGEDYIMRNFIVYTIHLIVMVIKYRRLRCAGHLSRMEEGRSIFNVLTGKPTGKDLMEGLGVDGKTILQ